MAFYKNLIVSQALVINKIDVFYEWIRQEITLWEC